MENTYEIIIYYKYTPIADPVGFVAWHKELCTKLELKGRILIAPEGINGTLEGTKEALVTYEERMHAQDGSEGTFGNFSDVWFKHSPGTGKSFPKLKVRARNEIVTLGLGEEDINPNDITGTHITPKELKAWIEAGEEFEIIDMRNDYEFSVGHFKDSRHPNLENFRDLPDMLPEIAPLKEKKVLTVCTYGVRCEKASGYLKKKGFKDVYQLDGGIGTYMKAYPGEDFLGSLYVFDERVLEQFTDNYEVVGKCSKCKATTENFTNCGFWECHKKMLSCEACLKIDGRIWCNDVCKSKTDMTTLVAQQ